MGCVHSFRVLSLSRSLLISLELRQLCYLDDWCLWAIVCRHHHEIKENHSFEWKNYSTSHHRVVCVCVSNECPTPQLDIDCMCNTKFISNWQRQIAAKKERDSKRWWRRRHIMSQFICFNLTNECIFTFSALFRVCVTKRKNTMFSDRADIEGTGVACERKWDTIKRYYSGATGRSLSCALNSGMHVLIKSLFFCCCSFCFSSGSIDVCSVHMAIDVDAILCVVMQWPFHIIHSGSWKRCRIMYLHSVSIPNSYVCYDCCVLVFRVRLRLCHRRDKPQPFARLMAVAGTQRRTSASPYYKLL